MPAGRNPDWDIPIEEFKWRIMRVVDTQNGPRAIYVAYPDARTVAEHLDRIFGPMNWKDSYDITGDNKGVICYLGIRDSSESDWVTKSDVGVMTDIESLKGGFSDAFKRTAAKWGVGRNAYEIPEIWGHVVNGKFMPRKTDDGRPYEEFLVEQAHAKLGHERPVGEYDAPTQPQEAAVAPNAQPAQTKVEYEVSDAEWDKFLEHMKGFSNERKERVKQWWEAYGNGQSKPQRDIDGDLFNKLFEYVTLEFLEEQEMAVTGEAF